MMEHTSRETQNESFLPVDLKTMVVDTIRSFDIFIQVKNGKKVLYHAGGELFSPDVRDKLIDNKVDTIYIRSADKGLYEDYVEENLPQLLSAPAIDTRQKSSMAYTSIRNIARSLFDNPRGETITRYKHSINHTLDFVMSEDEAIHNLILLTAYDFATYTHSVNVGIFGIGLARALFDDVTDNHDMHEIAAGFFLHDIGKCTIPHEILTKPGPLTPEEWLQMKNHPETGYGLLREFNALTEEAKVIVMQHHERHDGSGYPRALKKDQIHLYSKICAIADVFEALTALRPYKSSLSSFEALKIMQTEMHGDFDPYFFAQFVKLFKEHHTFATQNTPSPN